MNFQAIEDQIKCYEPHFQDYNYLDLQRVNAKLVITNQYIYYGQFANSQRNGKGIQLLPNGRKYEGEWKDDHKHGYGWELLANGSEYEGYYVMGKPHGRGKFTWTNGEFYDGDWNMGVKEGEGIWQGLNGDSYQGQWKNGKAEGFGEHIWKQGERYVGQFKEWLKNGEGQEFFLNGDRYQGKYLNGKPHGYGEYNWANGAMFQGYFKDGLRCGKGIWKRKVEPPTDTYQGEYDMDKKNGYGIYKWANGNEYRGYFVNDYKHGFGEMHYIDGNILKGNWELGKLVNEIKPNVVQKAKNAQENKPSQNNFIKANTKTQQPDVLNDTDKKFNGNPNSSQTQRTTKTIRIRQYCREKSYSMSQQSSQYHPSSPRDVSEKSEKLKTKQKFCVKANNDSYFLNIRRPKPQPEQGD